MRTEKYIVVTYHHSEKIASFFPEKNGLPRFPSANCRFQLAITLPRRYMMRRIMENFVFKEKPVRCVVLMSGSGSNARALLDYERKTPGCPYHAAAVVTDAPEACCARGIASEAGLPFAGCDIRRFYREHGLADGEIERCRGELEKKALEQAIGAKLLLDRAMQLDVPVSAADVDAEASKVIADTLKRLSAPFGTTVVMRDDGVIEAHAR